MRGHAGLTAQWACPTSRRSHAVRPPAVLPAILYVPRYRWLRNDVLVRPHAVITALVLDDRAGRAALEKAAGLRAGSWS